MLFEVSFSEVDRKYSVKAIAFQVHQKIIKKKNRLNLVFYKKKLYICNVFRS